MEETGEVVVALVTISSSEEGAALAKILVKEKLVACVNVIPTIRSIYCWQGETCDDQESLLILKTTRAAFDRLCARVVELHQYDVPEVVALPVVAGHDPYLRWVMAGVS